MKVLRTLPALALAAATLHAASTTTWELNSYQDFVRGRFTGVSLRRDGRMLLAPRLETLFTSEQPSIWSVAQAPDGTLYLGTGHHGRVYAVDASGKGTLYWSAEESEVFAVAVDAKGVLYAATSPNGKVYRIEKGKAAEYFAPGVTYIWSLAAARDGSLYVGTGDGGKIFRVTAQGKGEVWYDTGQSHITALALDKDGRLLAGSEPNGILYRVTAKDKAFVIYDTNLPEIRAIVPAADGSIYAAALGGSVAKRAASIPSITTTPGAPGGASTSTSITVTDTQAGLDLKPKPDASKPQVAQATPQVTTAITAATEVTGVDKSALYRIHPDNTVETLWTSRDENAYDLVATPSGITFSTDTQGRIYTLTQDRKVTLLEQTNEGEATRLVETARGLVAATGSMGTLFRISSGTAASGTYESPVHDSGTVARWGRLSWRADSPGGLRFKTRTGNTARPDRTWSDWSPPLADASGSMIPSPNARFIQWMAEFTATQGASPELDSVTVAYLPQNTPPILRGISVSTQASSVASKPSTSGPASTSPYSITVTDTGDAGATSASSSPTQTLSRSGTQQINVTWQADDPDGDRLLYSLYFRGDGEQNWKLLKSWIPENTYLLDDDVFADGKYFFRIVATDRANNPVDTAHEAEMTSSPVMIDNTPPIVRASAPRRAGALVEFDVEASDATGPLRRTEFSVDASPWTPVEAADGVTDSPHEQFRVRVDDLPPGEHLIVVRVFDSAGNAGLTKVVVR